MHYQGSGCANPGLLTSHQLGAASSAALEQQLRLSSDAVGGYLGTQPSNRSIAHPSAALLQPMNGGSQSMNSGAQPINGLQPINGGLQSMQSGLVQPMNGSLQPMNGGLQPMNSGLQSMQSGQMGGQMGSIAGSQYNQSLQGPGPYDHSGGFVGNSGVGGRGSSAFGGSMGGAGAGSSAFDGSMGGTGAGHSTFGSSMGGVGAGSSAFGSSMGGGSFYGNDSQVASGACGSHPQQFGSQAVAASGYESRIAIGPTSASGSHPGALLQSQAGGVMPQDVHNSSGQASGRNT